MIKYLIMRFLFLLIFGFGLTFHAASQQSTESSSEDSLISVPSSIVYTPAVKLKPRIGLGIGPMMLKGDLAIGDEANHLGGGKMAYTLSVSNELNSFLDLKVYSTFGRIQLTDAAEETPLYFKSQIRTGGFSVAYNFDHFLPTSRNVEPWISLGFEGVEFLSKADLYAANGERYHYWDNGKVMNMAQDDPNAANASMLQIDNVYETDIRELNQDGFGRYTERTFGIPVGAGVQFLMTERFKVQFGMSMTFLTSDFLDGRSDESAGARKGNAQNDRLISSHVSLNYDLNINPKPVQRPIEQFRDENGELFTITMDGDNDGVNDFVDKCLGTPLGAEVDEFGCPIDSDQDGYADYIDEETSSLHAYVDAKGIALSDDDIYQRYLMWNDSIPWITSVWKEDYAKKESDFGHWSNTYSVQVGAESEGLSQAQINFILSLDDVKTIEENGERIFLSGQYQYLPEAVEHKLELESEGFAGAVVENTAEAPITTVGQDAILLENAIRKRKMLPTGINKNVVFRIQIGAYRNKISENIFTKVDDLIVLKGDDQLTRYMSGSYSSIEDAADQKINLLLEGFDGAFITAYAGGKRITLAEAGARVNDGFEDLTYDQENSAIDPDLINFKIELGNFADQIPTETLDAFLSLGNVTPYKEEDGSITYFVTGFDNLQDAENQLYKIKKMTLINAELLGDFNGESLELNQATMLKYGVDNAASNE